MAGTAHSPPPPPAAPLPAAKYELFSRFLYYYELVDGRGLATRLTARLTPPPRSPMNHDASQHRETQQGVSKDIVASGSCRCMQIHSSVTKGMEGCASAMCAATAPAGTEAWYSRPQRASRALLRESCSLQKVTLALAPFGDFCGLIVPCDRAQSRCANSIAEVGHMRRREPASIQVSTGLY